MAGRRRPGGAVDPHAKALVFSEWERMLELVRELAQEMGIGFAWHTGSVPQDRRRADIRRFKSDPGCRLFLSTDSGGVGLNLQAASVVINLDLPWNPARLEQRIARAWRKHQTRPVQVIHLVTEGSIEHRMIPLLAGKQALADSVLDGRGDRSEMPLPSGRKALVERLEALTGIGISTGAAAPAHPPEAETPAAPAPETLRDDRLAALGEQLRIDRATLSAIERLIEAGVLQLSAEGRHLLHSSPEAGEPEPDAERERRLARARETFAQANARSGWPPSSRRAASLSRPCPPCARASSWACAPGPTSKELSPKAPRPSLSTGSKAGCRGISP